MLELVLWAGDLGFFGQAGLRLRRIAYDFGGFWPGLLRGWRPNYAAQPITMFVTYGFLHGGVGHLAMNMITLWSLGRVVAARVGQWGFLIVYGVTMLAGAAGFALLSGTLRPMVGASGALFGLAGAVLAWEWVDRRAGQERIWPVLRVALFLIGLNVVMWVALDGQMAWETHLGGFLSGWIVALWLLRREEG
ncbi:rhomboid family intramembrane serine protease [Jannaschia seosinensis]|uniref:rhomboid family intramembrane serine protease n=1 Tax=Jannaschia seosinensis TaxID=313367 RepID=UPI001FDEFE49|nr:rhomboid family intramembrane serine protease [Jannaschia seosinensis]